LFRIETSSYGLKSERNALTLRVRRAAVKDFASIGAIGKTDRGAAWLDDDAITSAL
jgi:hypothetical protein